jgi:hypothetical protein
MSYVTKDCWVLHGVGLRPLRHHPISQLLQLQWLFLSKYFHDKNVRTKNLTIKVPVLRSDGKETLTTNWEAFWQTQQLQRKQSNQYDFIRKLSSQP